MPPYWRNKVLQDGDSIPGSIILGGTFRRISQLWDNVHTLNMENCPIISQFLDFIHCMVFVCLFFFFLRDNEHTVYINEYINRNQRATGSGYFTFDKQLGVSLADRPSQRVSFATNTSVNLRVTCSCG